MPNKADEQLIEGWIALQYANQKSEKYERCFWAHIAIDNLIDEDPGKAWFIIEGIFNINNSPFLIANLAAGPLEDLLVKHGALVIEKIENSARSDTHIKTMLRMVWRNNISSSVWLRIQKIIQSSPENNG